MSTSPSSSSASHGGLGGSGSSGSTSGAAAATAPFRSSILVDAQAFKQWPPAGGLPASGRAVYWVLWLLSRISLPLFFSEITILGRHNIPKNAPCLFVANHNNDLIDGLLIATTCGRYLGFWGKAPIFKGFVGWLLRSCGGVPVVRSVEREAQAKEEHRTEEESAAAAAAAKSRAAIELETFDAFDLGRAMMVFPEGTSHAGPKLIELKDGCSWTALKYAAHNDTPLMIVPVGLVYLNSDRWRSEVVIKYGAPVQVTPQDLQKFKQEPKAGVKAFTGQLTHLLSAVTLNFPDSESLHLAHAARRIFMDYRHMTLAQQVEVSRRFVFFTERMGDNPEVLKLKQGVKDYEIRREKLALRDIDIFRGVSVDAKTLLGRGFERIFFVLLLLPITVLGMLLNGPTLYVARLAHRKVGFLESKASAMLLSGIVLIPVVYVLVAIIIRYFFETPVWQVVLAEMLLGLLNVRFLEEERNLARSFRASYRVLAVLMSNESRHELDKLRDLRAELQKGMAECLTKALQDHPEFKGFDTIDDIDEGELLDLGPVTTLNRRLLGRDSSRNDSSQTLQRDRELPLTDSFYDQIITQGHQ